MSTRDAIIALRRFGLGPRPGEARRIARDPRGYLLTSLDQPEKALIKEPLDTSEQAFRRVQDRRRRIRDERRAKAEARKLAKRGDADRGSEGTMMSAPAGEMASEAMASKKERREDSVRGILLKELAARVSHGARTDAGFVERLVMFWSNHLCVSVRKSQVVLVTAGAYEREAIRPHVLGRFVDMVQASARHPAMLHYLDNHNSIGPNSAAGQRRRKGLNENYARELLELHTVGVSGGYTQADVTNLARILTGWTVAQANHPEFGRFVFLPRMHEPGSQTVMGRRYAAGGVEQGKAVIDDLARHPATASYIATRLARHFVSENPPAKLVEQLASTFRETEGDLKAVARALVMADEAWTAPQRKILPPYDLLIAAYRALQFVPPEVFANRTLRVLGQPLWTVPSPKGWPDEDEHWAAPKAVMERLDWAETMVKRFSVVREVAHLAEDIYAGTLSDTTREAIERAPNVADGMVLFLMSSEFQRR